MMLALAVQMHREGEVLRRRKLRQLLFEFKRVGTEINVLLARDQPVDDLDDLRMQQRLAAGNRDHRRAALFHCGKTLFGGELLFEDVGRILHLAASGAGQRAAEERLQHQRQGIALDARELLLQHIAGNRCHLRDRNSHLGINLQRQTRRVPWFGGSWSEPAAGSTAGTACKPGKRLWGSLYL